MQALAVCAVQMYWLLIYFNLKLHGLQVSAITGQSGKIPTKIKMRTIEDVIAVRVLQNATTATVTKKLNPGRIIGVMAYKSDAKSFNTGMVRASIKDSQGFEVSKLQHIDNYRSRDCQYLDGAKPLDIEGGQSYTIDIMATAPFSNNLDVDFIFVYAAE